MSHKFFAFFFFFNTISLARDPLVVRYCMHTDQWRFINISYTLYTSNIRQYKGIFFLPVDIHPGLRNVRVVYVSYKARPYLAMPLQDFETFPGIRHALTHNSLRARAFQVQTEKRIVVLRYTRSVTWKRVIMIIISQHIDGDLLEDFFFIGNVYETKIL